MSHISGNHMLCPFHSLPLLQCVLLRIAADIFAWLISSQLLWYRDFHRSIKSPHPSPLINKFFGCAEICLCLHFLIVNISRYEIRDVKWGLFHVFWNHMNISMAIWIPKNVLELSKLPFGNIDLKYLLLR